MWSSADTEMHETITEIPGSNIATKEPKSKMSNAEIQHICWINKKIVLTRNTFKEHRNSKNTVHKSFKHKKHYLRIYSKILQLQVIIFYLTLMHCYKHPVREISVLSRLLFGESQVLTFHCQFRWTLRRANVTGVYLAVTLLQILHFKDEDSSLLHKLIPSSSPDLLCSFQPGDFRGRLGCLTFKGDSTLLFCSGIL